MILMSWLCTIPMHNLFLVLEQKAMKSLSMTSDTMKSSKVNKKCQISLSKLHEEVQI